MDNSLFEAMPKSLRPNIAVSAKRAKIPRGPRITWLNRAISLYLEYIGTAHLQLHVRAALLQVCTSHKTDARRSDSRHGLRKLSTPATSLAQARLK